MPERKTIVLMGCLLLSPVKYPQTDILKCGLCPNKSNEIKNLAKSCVRVQKD